MAHLVRTTIDELAMLADELEMNGIVRFSTEDPDELSYYNLSPSEYNLIYKSKIFYESDYVITIGLLDGHCTMSKDIYILANGNVDDEDSRIDGITTFILEYYEEYMKKNKSNDVYLIVDWM